MLCILCMLDMSCFHYFASCCLILHSSLSPQNEFPSELEFQLEVERLLVKEFAIECQQQTGLDTDRSQQPLATPGALMASVMTSRSKRNVKTK